MGGERTFYASGYGDNQIIVRLAVTLSLPPFPLTRAPIKNKRNFLLPPCPPALLFCLECLSQEFGPTPTRPEERGVGRCGAVLPGWEPAQRAALRSSPHRWRRPGAHEAALVPRDRLLLLIATPQAATNWCGLWGGALGKDSRGWEGAAGLTGT